MGNNNYIVRVQMGKEELAGFKRIVPLLSMSLNPSESNMIARILGYTTAKELNMKAPFENPFLAHAFSIISFLYVSREDPIAFNDFWDRLIFTDKGVERKVKRVFNIPSDDDSISAEQLELWYILDTDKEEWDDTLPDLG